MSKTLLQTDFPGLKLLARGKVRDIYDLGNSLLLVTSDRISAFDVIMNEPIPDKGFVLTQISAFWFRSMEDNSKKPYNFNGCRRFSEGVQAIFGTARRAVNAGKEGETSCG